VTARIRATWRGDALEINKRDHLALADRRFLSTKKRRGLLLQPLLSHRAATSWKMRLKMEQPARCLSGTFLLLAGRLGQVGEEP